MFKSDFLKVKGKNFVCVSGWGRVGYSHETKHYKILNNILPYRNIFNKYFQPFAFSKF